MSIEPWADEITDITDISDDYTGEVNGYTLTNARYNAVFTITLGELVDSGVFDWSNEYLDWSDAAYSEEQYERVCNYFIERFRYREISTVPAKEWFRTLHYKIVYELCPKYNLLYEEMDTNAKAFTLSGETRSGTSDDYYKGRTVTSEYPETLLSENADYATSGNDAEHETVGESTLQVNRGGEFADNWAKYVMQVESIDKLFCDELACMFGMMYTSNVNAF